MILNVAGLLLTRESSWSELRLTDLTSDRLLRRCAIQNSKCRFWCRLQGNASFISLLNWTEVGLKTFDSTGAWYWWLTDQVRALPWVRARHCAFPSSIRHTPGGNTLFTQSAETVPLHRDDPQSLCPAGRVYGNNAKHPRVHYRGFDQLFLPLTSHCRRAFPVLAA